MRQTEKQQSKRIRATDMTYSRLEVVARFVVRIGRFEFLSSSYYLSYNRGLPKAEKFATSLQVAVQDVFKECCRIDFSSRLTPKSVMHTPQREEAAGKRAQIPFFLSEPATTESTTVRSGVVIRRIISHNISMSTTTELVGGVRNHEGK